jgi:hypothetical protein
MRFGFRAGTSLAGGERAPMTLTLQHDVNRRTAVPQRTRRSQRMTVE